MNTPKEPPSKLNLRMPPALRAEAQEQADSMGVSLNAYCLLALRNFIPFTQRQTSGGRRPATARAATRRADSGPAKRERVAAGTWPKTGRNDPCPCESGKKWKHCHGAG